MIRQNLGGTWEMRNVKESDYLPANVPGSVYNDLINAGRMDDPYWRDNELKALKLADEDYEYRTLFVPDPAILASERAILRFHGIDTLADIFLNGELLGHVENMHRTWDYEVLDMLEKGENELCIVLYSPTKFIKEAYKENPADGSSDAMVGFPLLRKSHCMFGWDWGPRLPDAGIFRDVELLGVDAVLLDSVYITQHHENGTVRLSLEVELDCTDAGCLSEDCAGPDGCGLSYDVTVTAPDGTVYFRDNSPEEVVITKPMLWWPNGYGEQNLYGVTVRLYRNGKEIDSWERKIGLRTMTVHIEKDEWGESFAHEVNGVKIFAMGEDYIPEDCILSRITRERTFNLIRQCRDAHFNCIRVWGGGFYPNDDFYDACDTYGLVVWQDCMFACAVYNLTDEFEENITAELRDNIKRIRHHASLGLWCGNNEMEMFVKDGMWVRNDRQKADYIKMYEYIFPKIMKEMDPNTFYWPASPSSGGSFDDPNSYSRGDVHYWSVWHSGVPFTDFRKYYFRYLSEFGFQSFPSYEAVKTFTEPGDRNIFSYVMEKHQRNNAANGKIMNYMSATFLYPTDFRTLIYASQLLQAEAIKYGVEHFRRNRGRCMGAVVWQLNDCWPVASWSSIDYTGRWKAVHYYAKRFFAPVLISCEEEGLMTQDTNVNAEPFEVKKSIRFNVSNETMKEQEITIRWTLRSADAKVLRTGFETFTVPPLSAAYGVKTDLPDADLYGDYVSYDGYDRDGKCISHGSLIFSMPKHFRYQDPKLRVRVEGDEIVVSSEAYAKSVEIRNEDETLLLEDNYFDMDNGERRIRVISGNTDKLYARSVYDIR